MTGAELRARRDALGLSKAAFARALGIPLRTLEDWEAGRRAMRVAALVEAGVRELERTRASELAAHVDE